MLTHLKKILTFNQSKRVIDFPSFNNKKAVPADRIDNVSRLDEQARFLIQSKATEIEVKTGLTRQRFQWFGSVSELLMKITWEDEYIRVKLDCVRRSTS